MPLVEIKDFDALTESKSFLDQPVKEWEKRMKNLSQCQVTIMIKSIESIRLLVSSEWV